MRIQIVPTGIDIDQLPEGNVVRLIDSAHVEIALGPIPHERWADFVAFITDPEGEKAKQRARQALVMPDGRPRQF
jgi:hypothetical protein